jgi:glycosyltransferase involved in cell wall biosynthesis
MNELVSVPVLTYNAALFVEETLESIYNQTYQNIELIVSDDCSKDNTVEIVTKWCEQERVKKRFADIKIITVPKNTGIPSNFNRCIRASQGEWIKLLSGDDALMPNCVIDNLSHVINYPEIKILFSFTRVYQNYFNEANFVKLNPAKYPRNIIKPGISANEQYATLLKGNKVSFTPSSFYNKAALLDVGLVDEDIYSEDYQLFLKLTKKGYNLHFMDKETVLYRQHDNASNNTIVEYIIKPHYFKTETFRRRYIYPNISRISRLEKKFSWIVNQVFTFETMNKKTKLNQFVHYFLNTVCNPFKYMGFLKK